MTSNLIEINPANGALISTIGPILEGPAGLPMSINDLTAQPGTGTLFGVRADLDGRGGVGNLYTIDKTTGVATLVGNTGFFFNSLAFAPDGTLFLSSAKLDFFDGELFRHRDLGP